jgi:hypothetical protein
MLSNPTQSITTKRRPRQQTIVPGLKATEAGIDFCMQFSPAFSALTNDKLMIYERNLSQSH